MMSASSDMRCAKDIQPRRQGDLSADRSQNFLYAARDILDRKHELGHDQSLVGLAVWSRLIHVEDDASVRSQKVDFRNPRNKRVAHGFDFHQRWFVAHSFCPQVERRHQTTNVRNSTHYFDRDSKFLFCVAPCSTSEQFPSRVMQIPSRADCACSFSEPARVGV